MARRGKGFTDGEIVAYLQQGRPAGFFVYRKKKIQSPIPGFYDDYVVHPNGKWPIKKDDFERLSKPGPTYMDTPAAEEKIQATLEADNKRHEKAVSELEELKQKARDLWKKEGSYAVELGKTLIAIKEKLRHGQFTKWWKEEWKNDELSQNRVSYCMRLAQGKVPASKEKAKHTPRAKAFAIVTKKLAVLYDLAKNEEKERARQCFNEIKEAIEKWFIEKPKALAAHA